MANWAHLSAECIAAAKALLGRGYLRSCISRAYYAAYAAATARLIGTGGVTFPFGWANPSHEQLPRLIRSRLAGVAPSNRRQLVQAVRRLRIAREDADYRPQANVDRALALHALRDACRFLRILEKGS